MSFNATDLSLNRIISYHSGSEFYDNIYFSKNYHIYEDILAIYYFDNFYRTIFGGWELSFDNNDNVIGGTVTGFFEEYRDYSGYMAWWNVEGINYSATELYNAATTESTTDDYVIFSEILSENDIFNLSRYDDIARGYSGNDDIWGSDGNDILWGDFGNDTLMGGGGNDEMDGGAGNDFIYGGVGTDLAQFDDLSYLYTTHLVSGAFVVRGNSATQGADTLTSIENIYFSDLTLETYWFSKTSALTALQSDSLVELYIASFNRAPDAIGLNYWGGRLHDGMTLPEIAKSFFVQAETVAAYPASMSTRTFATTVYNNVLSRAPDTEGLNYWAREIDTGSVSKDVFLLAIVNGAKASTGSATDRQTLANKVTVGNYFAFDEGLNNTTWGIDVMDSVTSLSSTVTAANALTDRYSDMISTGTSSSAMMVDLTGVDTSLLSSVLI